MWDQGYWQDKDKKCEFNEYENIKDNRIRSRVAYGEGPEYLD